jgi:hypothetical protein
MKSLIAGDIPFIFSPNPAYLLPDDFCVVLDGVFTPQLSSHTCCFHKTTELKIILSKKSNIITGKRLVSLLLLTHQAINE